jgi:hypothetical protein
LIVCDGCPRGLRHVKVLPRRVAPSAIVAGQGVVGRAEVGCCDGDGRALFARLCFARVAGDGEAGATPCPIVEERRAQCSRVCPVPGVIQVPVPARTTCIVV